MFKIFEAAKKKSSPLFAWHSLFQRVQLPSSSKKSPLVNRKLLEFHGEFHPHLLGSKGEENNTRSLFVALGASAVLIWISSSWRNRSVSAKKILKTWMFRPFWGPDSLTAMRFFPSVWGFGAPYNHHNLRWPWWGLVVLNSRCCILS